MKRYLSILKININNNLQYKAAAIAGLMTQFFWGFMYIMIYDAFYMNTTIEQAFTFQQLVSYVWLQQAFLAFIVYWYRNQELFNMITNGNVAYELCRPMNLYSFWYIKLLSQRLASAFLRFSPIIIFAAMLPGKYRLMLPNDIKTILLFIISLFLGCFIIVSISMFIYILTFVTMSPTGILMVFGIIGDFFAGTIIPIPLMPESFQKIINLFPFRLVADFPFRVYSGNIGTKDAIIGIFIQIIWLLIFIISGQLSFRAIQRKLVVQGG